MTRTDETQANDAAKHADAALAKYQKMWGPDLSDNVTAENYKLWQGERTRLKTEVARMTHSQEEVGGLLIGLHQDKNVDLLTDDVLGMVAEVLLDAQTLLIQICRLAEIHDAKTHEIGMLLR